MILRECDHAVKVKGSFRIGASDYFFVGVEHADDSIRMEADVVINKQHSGTGLVEQQLPGKLVAGYRDLWVIESVYPNIDLLSLQSLNEAKNTEHAPGRNGAAVVGDCNHDAHVAILDEARDCRANAVLLRA